MGRRKKVHLGSPKVHKGRERVWWNGQWHDLGPAGSDAARAKYARLALLWADDPHAVPLSPDDYLIATLFRDYLASSDSPAGGQQRERVGRVSELLLDLFPTTAVLDFRVADLETWMRWLCKLPDPSDEERQRFNITTIKDFTHCLRRVWKWGVRKRHIPEERYRELLLAEWPKFGEARPPMDVEPADPEAVKATLPYLRPPVRAMVVLQLATGARPGEICRLRAGDVVRGGRLHVKGAGIQNLDKLKVWAYVPKAHKTAWRGKPRFLLFAGDAQKVLEPFLDRPAEAFCFRPAESLADLHAAQRADRDSRGGGSGGNRKKPSPTGPRAGTRYSTRTYRQAIERACQKAGVPHWSPQQLRHLAAAEVKELFGLDAVQALLGHHTKTMSEHYGGVAFRKAAEVAKARSAS